MTTISNPEGTPVVTYNRGGTAIVTLTAAGTNQSTAAAITRYSGYTVAVVTFGDADTGVRLPADAEIGDVVEIHLTVDAMRFVYPPSGESINDALTNTSISFTHALLRKVTATKWYALHRV